MSLAKRSIESSAYNVGANIIQTVILALRSILLARLLSPDDFGVYAFASSLVVVTSSLPNFGMGGAFVHRAKESEGEEALRVYFSLAFIFNMLWVVLIAIAGYFLIETENRWVLWVILITQIIDNLANVGRSKLVKKVVFRRIALVDTTVVLGATASALWFAYNGYGVWSLVSTDIAAALIMVIGFYIYRPIWRPRFGWAKETVRYFLDFGKRTFIAGVLGQALDRVDDLWTGVFLGKTALGYYSRAYSFATYPRKILAAPLNTVAGGTYAELKDQPKRLSQAFFRVNAFLVRSGFFFAGLLSLIAPEFIHLVIGDKWLPMLTAFRLMLVYTLLDPIKGTVAGLFGAVGRPELVTKARSVQLIILVAGLFLLGPRWGINGVALSIDIMVVVGIAILLMHSRNYVQFSLKRLIVVPSIAVCAGLCLAWGFIFLFGIPESLLKTGILKTFIFCSFYGIILFIFERHYFALLWKMVRSIFV